MDRQAIDAAVAAIRDDRQHGAAELARAGCELLGGVAAAGLADEVREVAERLVAVRPVMAAIGNWAVRFVEVYTAPAGEPGEAGPRVLAEMADVDARMVASAQQALESAGQVLTLSYSSSVLAALQAVPDTAVIVAESRPLLEGRKLASALMRAGREVTMISDAQMATVVADCAAVVLGADAIGRDGCVVNKVGSRLAALVAQD